MMIFKSYLLIIFVLSCHLYAANFPFPQSVNYPYGIKPNNVTQAQMNTAVLNAYNSWRNAYLTQDGCPQPNMWRVKRPEDGNDTVSEGIGYGMLITVLMTDANDSTKQYFDGLFRYYKHYNDGRNLMHWRIDANGNVVGYNAATDADEDVALALLFAHKQWGSSGSINYLQEATTIINALMQHCVEPGTYVLKPGDVWGGSSVTNPSYFAPGFYKVFALVTGDSRWNNVVNKCYEITNYFYNAYNTGLVPDWCQASGAQAGGYSYDYKYDACRFPWRYGIDYLWYGNTYVYNHLKKLSNWIQQTTGGNPSNIRDGYQLNGNVIGQWNNAAFVGPFAVAAMCDSSFQSWLNALYDRLVALPANTYYNDSLKVLTLLVITGNFPNLWATTDTINVYLVNPSSGSIIEGSTTVVVNVFSTTAVARVEFYVNNQLKFTDTTSPYSWVWDTTQYPDGGYELRVVGYTTAGSSDTKRTWVIINNLKEPPTILSVNLTNGTTLQGTVNITVNATDDTGISRVEFYINNLNVFTRTSPPYNFSWNTTQYSDGIYQFRIVVYDLDNLTTTYQCIIFIDNVDSLPTISTTSLQNGTTYQDVIQIVATASDDRGISRVELYVNNSLIYSTTTNTLNYMLNTTIYPDGVHTIRILAYDTANQQSQLNFTVYFDNIDDPPSCKILLYENQVVSGTLSIPIQYSDDKGISKIEYLLNDEIIATRQTPPFSYTIDTRNYPDNSYQLTIVVYDTIQQSSSAVVNLVFDNTSPQVEILLPADLSLSSGTTSIVFNVSDNYLLSRYELYINNILVSSKTLSLSTTQVVYLWNTLTAPTTSTIRVVAYDRISNMSFKQIKVFVDNQPPSITSISLYDEQVISGTVSILLQATDNLATKRTELYIENNLILVSYQTPYLFLLDTTSFPDGRYALTFITYDMLEHSSSKNIEVIINNSNNQTPKIFILVNSTNGVVSKNADVNIVCIDDDLIKSVWLYLNDVFISSFSNINASSFTYNWTIDTTKLNNNQLKITVRAYDSLTQHNLEFKTFVIDNTPPLITFQSPQNGAVVHGNVNFIITAIDTNGISYLECSILDKNNRSLLVVSTNTSTISFNLYTKNYPNGIYSVRAKAIDNLSNTVESTIYIQISNTDEKPNIYADFKNNSRISGELKVPISFSDDYGILKLEFYINNQLVYTYIPSASSESYIFNYNTLLLADGNYELKIICYDTANQYEVLTLNFIVDNIKDVFLISLDENPVNNVIEFDDYVEEMKIYDPKGRLVYHSTTQKTWDAKDITGNYVKSGVYIYSVKKQGKIIYGLVYVLNK